MNRSLPHRLLMRMPMKWLFFILKNFHRFIPNSQDNTSLKVMNLYSKLVIDNTYKAFCSPNKVIWTTIFLPSEILYAFNLIPFSMELASGMLGEIGFTQNALEKSDSLCDSTDFCTFHRASLGHVANGMLPKPIGIISYNYICNNNVQTPKKCAAVVNKPLLHLDVPLENDNEAIPFLASGIRNFVKDLENLTKSKLNPEKLREVVINAEKTRKIILKINDLRKVEFAPSIVTEALNFFVIRNIFTGSQEGVVFFQKLYEELLEITEKIRKLRISNKDKSKIIWLEYKPCYKSEFFNLFMDKDHEIVFEEMNYIEWPELNPEEPFESLAKKIISCHYNQTGEKRLSIIEKLTDDYKADAVVSFSNWGCRRNNLLIPTIKKRLNDKGISFLNIDSDSLDPTVYMHGQIKTRIEAFMEQLVH